MDSRQELMDKFKVQYSQLNTEQKQAVDNIEGPQMVIAGAGTGKTQTIALRIANIRIKTDTEPQNILCLTFTDTGTVAMRQRLISIMGSDAYKVRIHTFHSFCNEIIKNNPEYFIFAKNIESLDEIEKIEIIQNLISTLSNGSVLKPWGDNFYYQRDIISSIQSLKRESITPEVFETLLNDQIKFLSTNSDQINTLKSIKFSKNIESDLLTAFNPILASAKENFSHIFSYLSYLFTYFQSGGFEVGAAKNPAVNFKNELIKFFDNLEKDSVKQSELLKIYQQYQTEIQKRGRYDFEDMVLFVIKAFKDNPELLQTYQEKYQYILVDEYQDTNTSQNTIIDYLGSYYDNPNIFVVGDDDQSIFRFQGASIENVFSFYQKYQVKPIVLKNNYRSHRLILESSESVIKNNKNRISSYINDIDKSLKSQVDYDPTPVNLCSAPGNIEENYFIAAKIKELLKNGVDPQQIAVLYRNNNDALELSDYLKNNGIKFQLNIDKDVLQDSYIRQLIFLLEFIKNPESNQTLYKVLSSNYLKVPSTDLFKLTHFCLKQKVSLVSLLFSKENFDQIRGDLSPKAVKRLKRFVIRVTKSKKLLNNTNLDRFFNKVIRRFGYLKFVLSKNNLELVNFLNTIYSQIKKLSLSRDYDLTQFLEYLELLSENNINLVASEISGDNLESVRLMTVHKSKGLEFEHVFLYKCVDKKWGNNGSSFGIRLPLGILKTEISLVANMNNNEDERRLFYVALTRAKKQIYVSYSTKSDTSRDQLPSMFISEIDNHLIENVVLPKNISELSLLSNFPLNLPKENKDQIFKDYLSEYLEKHYKFNITHLNSYLRCPYCFFHKTILRIPAVREKHSSFGTAVHASLSFLYDTFINDNVLISKNAFIDKFIEVLKNERLTADEENESIDKGKTLMSEYYDNYQSVFNGNCLTDYDFAPNHVFLDDIPITGKIDLIQIKDEKINGKLTAQVIDFKTGNPDGKYKELSKEGEYFRQLVFYKILSDLDPVFKYHIDSGTIDFVQKSKTRNKFVQNTFSFNEEDIADLKVLIKDVYQKIINLDFYQIGSDCKDSDKLHCLLKGDNHEN